MRTNKCVQSAQRNYAMCGPLCDGYAPHRLVELLARNNVLQYSHKEEIRSYQVVKLGGC